MADPTTFSIPRRRMGIGTYTTSDSALIKLRDVGIINSAEVTFNRETNAYRAVDLSGGECREYVADTNNTAGDGQLAVEMMSTVAANLGVMLSSAVTTVATAAADQETMPTMAVGDVVQTNYIPDSSTIVVKDDAGTPATLVLGTDYEFVSKKAGLIRILSLGAYTQPFTIDYTKLDSKTVSPMSDLDDYYYIVLAGGNERNSCGGEIERFYRARISDAQTKALHQAADVKTPQPMTVTFTIDRDPARSYAFGQFAVTEA